MTARDKQARRYHSRRAAVIRRTTRAHNTDTVLITNTADIRYLSGCTEGAGGLLFGSNWAVIFTSKMFEEVVPKQAPGIEVALPEKGAGDGVADALNKRRIQRAVGFQGNTMTWAQHAAFSKALGRRKLVNIADVVKDVRAVKDEGERRLIRRCVRLAERAFGELIAQGTRGLVGRTENELAAELEYRMRMLGADRQGFPFNGIIVASGPNSASCHHFPTNRKVRRGEPLLFDWGAEVDGYRSDITRTLWIGANPKSWFREIYEVVERANRAGIAPVRPGVATSTVAQAGWGVVRDAGFGDLIRHGLGHGIGLDIHEAPGLGNGLKPREGARDTRLRKNMVVTIEPGIYHDGRGGVRIEDDILVTAKGHRCLTTLPRDLVHNTIGIRLPGAEEAIVVPPHYPLATVTT